MSISIKGLENLYKKLGATASIRILEKPMARSLFRLQSAMQVYPPPPADSTYRRTGSYGRRWTTRINASGAGLIGRVGTNLYYAPFVGSRMFQTSAHRATGWETDAGAVQANEGQIIADFQHAIDRALAS